MLSTEQMVELMEILEEVYKPHGAAIWLADAARKKQSYEVQLQRALNARDGNFS